MIFVHLLAPLKQNKKETKRTFMTHPGGDHYLPCRVATHLRDRHSHLRAGHAVGRGGESALARSGCGGYGSQNHDCLTAPCEPVIGLCEGMGGLGLGLVLVLVLGLGWVWGIWGEEPRLPVS